MSTSGVLSTNPDTTCTVVSGSRSSSPNTRSPRNAFAMRKRGVVGTKTVDGVSEKLVLPAPTVRIATTSREAGRRAIDAGSPLLSSLVISQSHSPLLGKEGGGGASFTSLTRRSSKSPKIDDGAQHRRHRRTTPDERQKVEGLVSSFENLVRRLSISGGTPPPPQLGSSAMAECGDGHASGRATTDSSPATSPPLIIPTTSNTPKSILSPSGGGMLSPSSPHRRMSTVRLDSANMNASGADQFGRYLDSMLNTLQQGGDVAEEDERQRSVEEFSHNMRELFLLAQSCSEVLREDGGDVVTNSNSSGKGSPPLAPTARQRSNDISQLDFPYIDSVTSPPFAEIHRLPGCLPDGYAGQMLQLRPPGLSSAEDHELNADRHNLHHGCFLRTRRESNSTNAESVVNEFSVVRTLGYGTTSKVRLCINLQTNEEVAMKSMNRPQVGPKYALLHPRSESSSEVGDSEENQGSSNGEASVTSSESDDELLYSLSSPIMRRDQPTDFTRTASLKRSSRDAKTMKAASSENLLHHDLTELADVSASGCTTPVHHVMRSSTMCPSSIAAVMPPSEREIRFLRRMHHPHVVCLHEVIDDEEENVVHLILTYAPKGPITHVHPYDDFVGRAPCDLVRPLDRFVRYLQQIVAAVDYMHSQRIVHNDLKPDNILRTAKDDVIITDFGESVLVPKSGHHNNTTSVQVNPARWGSSVVDAEATLDGSLHFGNNSSCSTVNPDSSVYISAGVGDDGKLIHRVGAGTPAFAAPEVVEHNECSYKTDVWSIGVLIYSMLCGRLPFAAPTLPATFEAIIQCEPQFPSLEEIDISSDLTTESYEQWKELCRTLLAKNPQDRLTTGELKTHPLLTAHPSYVLERGRGSRSKVKTGAKSFRKEASDAMSSAAGTPSLPPSSPILVNRPRSGQLDRHHPAPAPRVVVSVPTFDEPPPLGDANASSATLPPNSEVHDIADPSSPNSCPASSSSTQHRRHNSPSLRSSPLRRPTSSAHHSNQASPPTKPEADEQRRLSTRSHLHNKMEAVFRSTEDRMMDYSSGTSIKGPSSGATCSTFGDSDRLTSPDSHASPLIRPRREFSRRQTLVTIVEPLQSIEISTNFVEKRTM